MSNIWKDHLDDLRVPHGTPHCRNRHSSWCSHGRGRWWPVWPVWCRTGASQGQQDQMGIHEMFINKSHKRLPRFLGFETWWSILHHEWDVSFFGMPGCLYQYIGVSKHIFRLCLDMALSGFDFSDERVYVGGWWMVVGPWKWWRFECLTSKRRLIKDTVTTLDRGICQTPAFDLNADGLLPFQPFHPFHPPLDLTGHLRFRWSCLCRSQRLKDGLRIRHHQRVDMTFQAFQGTIAELQLLPGLTPWLCWNLERLTKCHVLLWARSLLQVNRFWTCLPVSYQISNMWSNGFRIVIESLRSGLFPIARSRSFLCPDEVGHRPCPRHGFIKPNRVWMLLVLTPLLVEYVNTLRSTVWWYVYSTYVRRRRHVNYVCTYNSAICRRMHTHIGT